MHASALNTDTDGSIKAHYNQQMDIPIVCKGSLNHYITLCLLTIQRKLENTIYSFKAFLSLSAIVRARSQTMSQEDATALLNEFVWSIENLPNEVAYLLEEIAYKDERAQGQPGQSSWI